ncbi:hypothetical protein MC885_019045 [Smutsia gigantea]|nr:hypothetical protein MC885_019045 [Smutsia gigantea]
MTRFHLPHLGPPPLPPPPSAPFPNTRPVQPATTTLERGWISFFHQIENCDFPSHFPLRRRLGCLEEEFSASPSFSLQGAGWLRVTRSHTPTRRPWSPCLLPPGPWRAPEVLLWRESGIPWPWDCELAAPHTHPEGSTG